MNTFSKVKYLLPFLFLAVMISGAEAEVLINECQKISSAGNYSLNNSISTNGTCLIIDGEDIVLDGKNFSITGTGGGYGVYVSGSNYVKVVNITADSFSRGIYVKNSKSVIVDSVQVINNTDSGIQGDFSQNLSVLHANASGNNNSGIFFYTIDEGFIGNSLIENGFEYGVRLKTSENIRIGGIESRNNENNGIYVHLGSHRTTIYNSSASNNKNYGIRAEYSNKAILRDIITENNSRQGILLLGSNRSVLEDIVSRDNMAQGIRVELSDDLVARNIQISNNHGIGIVLLTSSNNSISNISSINNNGHGVYFEKSPRNSIFNSKIMSNNGSGFHIVHNSSFIILENNDIYDGRNGIYTERSTNILLNRSFINSSQKEAVLLNLGSENISIYGMQVSNTANGFDDIRTASAGVKGIILWDVLLGRYTFIESMLSLGRTGIGEIVFLSSLDGSGSNLSLDIFLDNATIELKSTSSGMNVSANVTFTDLPLNASNHTLLKDGEECLSSVCLNSTELNGSIVKFSVPGTGIYKLSFVLLLSPQAPTQPPSTSSSSSSNQGGSSSQTPASIVGTNISNVGSNTSFQNLTLAGFNSIPNNELLNSTNNTNLPITGAIIGSTYPKKILAALIFFIALIGIITTLWYKKKQGTYW
ncbi:right-handed parallel beta-helix repeat-containing protein [Candidatus Pacearchaeota archaeon]|nr:right-handed parallel beta-helix repeat-containing protein [Candidatus Pacearchaeota archaeon]